MGEVRRALISVFDKAGLIEFASRLVDAGVELVSSGGTARTLAEAGLPVVSVESVTNAPEMLGGRVKTLHPRIHAGILADQGNADHMAELRSHDITPFDLVVVNLYPFEATAATAGVTESEIVEQIDIGGPTMIRAAAKNHQSVGVVTSPDLYDEVADAVAAGGLSDELRRRLARVAFFHTARYDAAIVEWMERGPDLPERAVLAVERFAVLRYGENPHQPAGLYRQEGSAGWWSAARQLQGKPMSFNNYADAEAAWRLVQAFAQPACVIVKHANPCGVAIRPNLADAASAAWSCDPLSAFGGVVALNRPLDAATADVLAAAGFVEIIVVPEVVDAAGLAAKTNLRLIEAGAPHTDDPDWRRVDGGFLLQQRDEVGFDLAGSTTVTLRHPTEREHADLEFAWTVAAHTKSNAIVVVADGLAVGIGAGDQSRVGAAERALAKAGERADGAVAASDAFFPFPDGIDVLAAGGVTAVVQPGGSKGDETVVAAADEHDMAMVFTHRRHFLH